MQKEKKYWYAVLANEEDDWFYGSLDLEEAMKMTRGLGPEAFIAVIDDTDLRNQKCVRYITQAEFETVVEIEEGYKFSS